MRILAFESSCDETAAAVVEDGRKILSDVIASQAEMHALYGGVVPEIASRKHVEAIAGLTEQALLQVFDDFAKGSRLAFLTLEVRPSNAAAIALYRGFGFREAGRRRNYYDLPKEDALILTKYYTEEAQA